MVGVTMDPAVLPGLLLLGLALAVLAAMGFLVARMALGQTDCAMALAQGMVIGPALWGLAVNVLLNVTVGRGAALAGWVVILAAAVVLVRRAPHDWRVIRRTVAWFGVAALTLFSVALAGRQLLGIADPTIHLGLAAAAQAGQWPLVLPWVPNQPLLYHYGVDLLIGLLAPPVGPDLAFTTEIVSTYIWTSFALVTATLLRQHGGRMGLLTLAPLLLTAGAWTLIGNTIPVPDLLRIPVPTGIPTEGLRASLASLYWPEVSLHWETTFEASPRNIWNPQYVLSYALALVVLERAAADGERTVPRSVTLALLVSFLGLVSEEIVLLALALWVGLEAIRLLSLKLSASSGRLSRLSGFRRRWAVDHSFGAGTQDAAGRRCPDRREVSLLRAFMGPTFALLLLVVFGGPVAALLTRTSPAETFLAWHDDPGSRRPFGTLLDVGAGGVGALGLGAVPVGMLALLLGWRHRLVLALVAAGGVSLLAALTLQYAPSPYDVTRLDGHARNFALLAFLVALSGWLPWPPWRWRLAAIILLAGLVVWPTVGTPIRTLALSVGRGVTLANPEHGSTVRPDPDVGWGRYRIRNPLPDAVIRAIRESTSPDDVVLSPVPHDMTSATGQPNAAGFLGHTHYIAETGPAYEDAVRYLEPAAVGRLGARFVHATDDWVAKLPDRARRSLADSRPFEPLTSAGGHAVYRIQPAFLHLEVAPTPASFEALRQAIPSASTVYVARHLKPLETIRVATTLAYARLLAEVDPTVLHLNTDVPTHAWDSQTANVLVAPRGLTIYAAVKELKPIWWNDAVAVYVPDDSVNALMDPPSRPERNFSVRLTKVRSDGQRVRFQASFTNRAPDRWTGQDWLVAAVDDSSWAFPYQFEADGRHVGHQWYAGQIGAGQETATHTYAFEPQASSLSVLDENGAYVNADSSGNRLAAGAWTLAVRLRNGWHEAAFIPVMRITVAETGEIVFEDYEGDIPARLAQ